MLGGELVGASLGDRWGAIHEPKTFHQTGTVLFPSTQTAQGFTFVSPRLPGSICNPNVPLPTCLDS